MPKDLTDMDMNHSAHEHPFIGIHLSGANTPKTAVVSLRLMPGKALTVEGVYEKIVSYGSIFSDERLVDILRLHQAAGDVFVDAPLTSSPCEMCVRPVCPGALRCEDLAVAYMLRLNEEAKVKKRRKRPLNPQSQRLWDVAYSFDERFEGLEPSFSTNKSPLVARARALAKRLQSLTPAVYLQETSVPHALAALASGQSELAEACRHYRNFEAGLQYRKDIVAALQAKGWLAKEQVVARMSPLYQSVEVFHALVAAMVAARHRLQQTTLPPDRVYVEQGWVYIPEQWQDAPRM